MIAAEIVLTDCYVSTDWIFGIVNGISPDANPAFVTLSFAGGPTVDVPQDGPVSAGADAAGPFVAFYTWDENSAGNLESATARVDASIAFDFFLIASPACVAPPIPSATATSTPGSLPTQTAWPTHTPRPETPVPSLPSTGAGSFGSGGGLVLLAGTAVLAALGLAFRRWKLRN